jgi:hypothetical protein
MEIKNGKYFPEWAYQFYEGYKDIERLIILAQRNKYFRSKESIKNESVLIDVEYRVNLKHNVQNQTNDLSRQR